MAGAVRCGARRLAPRGADRVGGARGARTATRWTGTCVTTSAGVTVLAPTTASCATANTEPFGFVDGRRQPAIAGLPPNTSPRRPGRPVRRCRSASSCSGTRPSSASVVGGGCPASVPSSERIGFNGSFAALRLMRQDVDGLRGMGGRARRAGRRAALRRAEGTATACRAAPRSVRTSGGSTPPAAARQPRIPRPPADPPRRTGPLATVGAGAEEVGMIGLFICASLAAQYEAVLAEWMHHAIHDPRITGTNDPFVGVARRPRAVVGGHPRRRLPVPARDAGARVVARRPVRRRRGRRVTCPPRRRWPSSC